MAIMAFMPATMNATHIVGGDMSYKCLGNDFYEVTLTLRRDCINGAEDAPFDEQAAVGIFDKTGRKLDFVGRLGILYMPFSGADTIRNNVPDCALEGGEVCVHESVYTAQIFLPFREQGYVLTYQRCCRNGTLNNIIDPLETGATRTVCISRESQLACNSGPAFGEYPDIIACVNDDISFDASATDPDGDVLVYKLATPYTGASIDYPKPQPPWNPPYNSFVEYAEGFSEDNMLGSGTPLAIDENTGLITGTPGVVGQYLVGIIVEEWKNGEIIGETRRDFEYNVRVCRSFPEIAFDAPDNCAGLTVDITNNTIGAVSYLWNFNYPSTDPAFMSTDENPGSFTYSAPGIYNIRLEATDDGGDCVVDLIKEVRAFNSQMASSFTASNGCCLDGKTELSLVSTSEEPSSDFAIASYDYTVTINGEMPFTLSGANRTLTVSCSDEVIVTLVTTSTSGCTASVTETITIDQDFGGKEGNICMKEITICIGNTGTIGPLSDARTYEWTPEGVDLTDPLNPIFTPSETTVYTVVATDANGARSTGTVTVNVIQSFDLTIQEVSDVECLSQVSFTALANRDDLTYQWAATNDFVNILATGNPATIDMRSGTNSIYVKATSPEGCEEVDLLELESSILSLKTNVSEYNACSDEFSVVTIENLSPDQNVSIVWEGSDNIVSEDLTSPSINVAAVGSEKVISLSYTATNDAGCEFEGTVDIPVMRSISASITGVTISCDGNFNLLANSNAPNATFEWSLNSDFSVISGSGPNFPITLTEGTTLYMRASVDQVCVSEIVSAPLSLGTFEVDFDKLPAEICVGDEVLINGTSSDPTVSIEYGPSDNIISTPSSTSVVIGVISGQSEVEIPYIATNSVGCEVTGSLRIDVGTTEQPIITFVVDCSTGDVMFTSGKPDGTLTWDFGDGNSSTDGNPTNRYASGGTYTVTLASNATTCKFETISDEIIVPELFSLEPNGDTDVKYCGEDPVTLSVTTTGDVAIAWQDGEGNFLGEGNEITLNPNGIINTVKAIATSSDPACGMSMIEYTLSQYNFDLTRGDVPDVICPGDNFELSVVDNTNSDLTYEWMPASVVVNGGDTPNATISLDTDTDVVVRITSAEFMCSTEEIFSIDLPELELTASADPDPNIFLCDEVVIFADPDDYSSYEWSNGVTGTTQSVIPTETTTYTVTATDANGCTITSSVTINVEIPPCNVDGIFVPSAFSPNSDGSNDLLLVRSNAVKEMDFYIVDRWGNEVFRTDNQRVGWNGQFGNDGRELSPDVYAWCLAGRCSDGNNFHMVGNVTLLR